MTKIYLRAGHGGRFPGTSGHGLVEKDLTLEDTLALFEILSGYEVDLKLARDKDVTMRIAESVAEANEWGADLYYSKHHNGFRLASARGFDTHIHPRAQERTREIQRVIHPIIARVWTDAGSRDRGFKTNDFYELRETRMPAIIIENGFLTNPDDAALLKNTAFRRRLVEAEARALVGFFNLKKKPVPAPAPDRPVGLYRVIVDGRQLYALQDENNILRQVKAHLGKAKEIRLEKV